MTSVWSALAVAAIADNPVPTAPVIDLAACPPVLPGFDVWDYWPVQECDSRTAVIAGGTLFMLLSAPVLPDPDQRHAIARIRLMHHTPGGWHDLGPALPDGLAPGSREWSGSAIISPDHDRVTLYFTAAGHRDEAVVSFDQRLFETSADLHIHHGVPALLDWTAPVESVRADGAIYARDMAGGGAIGTIKAFRDPTWFCDPADNAAYLIFAASLAQSASHWNGAVGVARRDSGQWVLRAPIITADGLNNELERPHIVHHNGRYVCFWSTQRKVFADGGPAGPNGLYGMVADRIDGPWAPLNGTGLVFANPLTSPVQAYSWQVLADLSVISFVDRPGLADDSADPTIARRHFGGTPAPVLQLALDGNRAWLV
ncbi:glycoside hydrolase family 68 protein [Novosphingobium sp.]|uniref:glycoside hydrolase family 68 protein n=1 Tax=Novosphingobium sp. TaxID=1874826 RepID=UPI003342A359